MKINKMTKEKCHDIFYYDVRIGVLRWKIDDTIAGSKYNGYRRIQYENKKYKSHILIWIYQKDI